MAFVRSLKTSNQTTNLTSITVDPPDEYEAGDAFLMLATKDTSVGPNLSTPAGWTKIGEQIEGSSVVAALYLKENVSAVESSATVTSSDADSWSAFMIAVGGVAASGVLGAVSLNNFNVATSGGTAYEHDMPGLTTTAANSLVFWLYGSDASGQALLGGNARLINYEDGVGVGAYGWYKTIPGIESTGTLALYSGSGEQFAGGTIEILDGSSGAEIMPYQLGGIHDANVINPLHGIESNSYLGGTTVPGGIVQAPLMTALAGRTVNVSGTLQDQVDANSVPYARAMRMEADRVANTAFGVTLDVDRTGADQVIDLSGSDKHVHLYLHHRDFKIHSIGGKARELGVAVALHDNAGNWKAWGVDGRDAARKLVTPPSGPVVIQPDSTENVLDSSGVLDTTQIQYISFVGFAELANNYFTYICNIFVAEPFVLLGGSPAFPASMDTIIDYAAAKGDAVVERIGESYLSRGLVHVGNGADHVEASFDGKLIQFAPSDVGMHIKDDYLGLVVISVAGALISGVGSTWTSSTPFRFDVQNGSGAIDFKEAIVTNAQTFNIRGDFSGATLTPAAGSKVDDFGATVDGARVIGDMNLHTQKDLDSLSVTGALDFGVSGTYALDGCLIEEVTNSSGGAVVLNLSNGAEITTNSGPSITVNNAVDLEFVDIVSGSRLLIQATDSVGSVSDGDVLVNDIVVSNPFIYSHNFEGPLSFLFRVRKADAAPFYIPYEGTGSIENSGFKATISQETD